MNSKHTVKSVDDNSNNNNFAHNIISCIMLSKILIWKKLTCAPQDIKAGAIMTKNMFILHNAKATFYCYTIGSFGPLTGRY